MEAYLNSKLESCTPYVDFAIAKENYLWYNFGI